MQFTGRAWVFGRNVNTDLIFPKVWFRPSYQPGEMAGHLMTGLDPEFPKKVRPGDIIVGGLNFGCGSSREEAAGAMKEAGVVAVIAPTFGRLFTRNCINLGLPAIAVASIDEQVATDDELAIDLTASTLKNLRSGFATRLAPMAPESLRLLADGGIIGYTRRILAERRAADGKSGAKA